MKREMNLNAMGNGSKNFQATGEDLSFIQYKCGVLELYVCEVH
jgi:hypothetical protein